MTDAIRSIISNLMDRVMEYVGFVEEINRLGKEYKNLIYRDFLNIEPPTGFDVDSLR